MSEKRDSHTQETQIGVPMELSKLCDAISVISNLTIYLGEPTPTTVATLDFEIDKMSSSPKIISRATNIERILVIKSSGSTKKKGKNKQIVKKIKTPKKGAKDIEKVDPKSPTTKAAKKGKKGER